MNLQKPENANATLITATTTATKLFDLMNTAGSTTTTNAGFVEGANSVMLTPEDGDIRILSDVDPSATKGFLVSSGETINLANTNLKELRFIRVGGSDVAISLLVGKDTPEGGASSSVTAADAVGGSVAGSTTQVQYNNAGAFGAEAAFTYNAGTDTLTAVNTATTITTAAQANITSLGSLTSLTMGGDVTLGENGIALDPAMSADGKYSGTTITGTAGATLAFGDLIYLDPTDSRWELADANSAAAADGDARGMLGICVLAAAGDASATTILLQGMVRADTAFPALTINAPVYAGEVAGDVVVTQPTTTDVVIRVLGSATTADEMYFNPSADYITAV